jgi:hypothetical protein
MGARSEGPCGRTAKQRDESPPPHVGHGDFLPSRLRRDNPSGRFFVVSACRKPAGKSLGQF